MRIYMYFNIYIVELSLKINKWLLHCIFVKLESTFYSVEVQLVSCTKAIEI